MTVDRNPAEIMFGEAKAEIVLDRQLFEAADSLGGHFRADTVTGQYDDVDHAACTFLVLLARKSSTACALLAASM
jgi:hypothetical protein